MDSFDSIWRLQSFLLSEADRCNIPIVHNHDREKAKKEITRTIINDLRSHFGGKPADVFGSVAEGHRDPEWRSFLMRLVA